MKVQIYKNKERYIYLSYIGTERFVMFLTMLRVNAKFQLPFKAYKLSQYGFESITVLNFVLLWSNPLTAKSLLPKLSFIFLFLTDSCHSNQAQTNGLIVV